MPYFHQLSRLWNFHNELRIRDSKTIIPLICVVRVTFLTYYIKAEFRLNIGIRCMMGQRVTTNDSQKEHGMKNTRYNRPLILLKCADICIDATTLYQCTLSLRCSSALYYLHPHFNLHFHLHLH